MGIAELELWVQGCHRYSVNMCIHSNKFVPGVHMTDYSDCGELKIDPGVCKHLLPLAFLADESWCKINRYCSRNELMRTYSELFGGHRQVLSDVPRNAGRAEQAG